MRAMALASAGFTMKSYLAEALTLTPLFPQNFPKALKRASPETITSDSSDPRLSDHASTVPSQSARSRGPLPR